MTETVHVTQGTVVVHSCAVVGELTRCELFYCMCDLKATQTNVKRRLIRELTVYEFELNHNATETTNNISEKGEGAINHYNQMVQEFFLDLWEPQ